MHATLSALLENQRSGLLWVHRDGGIRYANALATGCSGLAAGGRLYDPDMARAVSDVVARQQEVALAMVAPLSRGGGADGTLHCRVLPGLARDDAFVLIGDEASARSAQDAFTNLTTVIQAGLRDPLARAWQSLEAARREVPGLGAPLDDMAGLMTVLDRLVDLAGIWGEAALLGNDRIDAAELAREVGAAHADEARARSVQLRLHCPGGEDSLAPLYGSRTWLHRVLSECLASALQQARGGSALELELRQVGARVLFTLRDGGLFTRPAQDRTDLRARRDVPRAAAADPIGLLLCRHVLALHGGTLRETRDDDLHHVLIDLPSGAPLRGDATAPDLAQAQRYAQDLAALMARARGRKRERERPGPATAQPTTGAIT